MRWIQSILVLWTCTLGPRAGWPDMTLVRVGDAVISAADLERARSRLPSHLRTKDRTWLLETLINRQLLVQEAWRQGLDSSRAVRQGLESALVRKLTDALFERGVASTVELSEEELLEAFASGPFAQRLEARVAHIVVATREEAETLLTRLAAGEAFADLARQHSLDSRTAERGGEIGIWQQGEVVGPIAEQAWTLDIGAVSPPVRDADGRYHLVTVLERRPAGFEAQRPLIENRVRSAKIRTKRAAFVDSLLDAYDMTLDDAALQLLLQRGRLALDRIPPLEATDGTAVLVRYRGGAVALSDYISWLRSLEAVQRRPYPVDREQIERFARLRIVTEKLYPLEARRRSLHQAPELADWTQRKREDLMIEELRRVAVEAVVIGEEDIARYYEAHGDEFVQPERLFVEAALAANQRDADRIRAACERNGDLAAAAAAHPLPTEMANYRVFSFTPRDDDLPVDVPPALVDAALGLGDSWTGPTLVPLATNDPSVQYAVFRLLQRRAEHELPASDPEVRKRILEALRQAKADALERKFGDFVTDLRRQYDSQIHYSNAPNARSEE